LAVSVNESSDGDGDTLFTGVDWWRGTELNATTGKPDDSDVVGWWTFDQKNTSTIEDFSVQGKDGTITNASFTNDSAMGLGAYKFDGVGDWVNIGDQGIYDFWTNNFSVEAWVKPATTFTDGGAQGHVKVITKSLATTSYAGWNLGYVNDYGNGGWRFKATDGTNDDPQISQKKPAPPVWTHLVGVRNSTGLALYVNGVRYDANGAAENVDNTKPVYIGTEWWSTIGHRYDFPGLIDEVRIYNRSLTYDEVQQRYWAGVKRGLILNHSLTKKDDKWNATVTLYDDDSAGSTPMNFSFGTITSCGYLAAEGDWNIDGEDGCTLDRNYDLGNNDVTIEGEGIFSFNGFNITNINKITMRGISATQRLIVRCIQGSCFKQ
jgi:hypothetical protein